MCISNSIIFLPSTLGYVCAFAVNAFGYIITQTLTSSTAELRWSIPFCGHDSYKIEGAGPDITGITTKNITLIDLTPGTRYDITLQTIKNGDVFNPMFRLKEIFTTLNGGK